MLLPLIGAGLGGYEAYRRSGGNLGATALGAGLGAATPAGLRFAGTALAGTPIGAAGLGALNKILGKAGIEATKQGIGNLAAVGGTTLLGAPGLAGTIAAGMAPAAKTAAGGTAGLAIPAMQPGQAVYDAGGAVPTNVPVGASPYGTLDITNPAGPFGAGRTAQLLEADVQLANIRKLMPELFKAAEARSKTEFQRQMAAAGIRQNIATAANMLERSQQAAQQMGLNAASQMGSALTSQYQYQ